MQTSNRSTALIPLWLRAVDLSTLRGSKWVLWPRRLSLMYLLLVLGDCFDGCAHSNLLQLKGVFITNQLFRFFVLFPGRFLMAQVDGFPGAFVLKCFGYLVQCF